MVIAARCGILDDRCRRFEMNKKEQAIIVPR